MLKEVIDDLKQVKEGIETVKEIVEAIKTGEHYVKTKHPEIQNDLRAMVDELGKNLLVIKKASSVLTNFRFGISAGVTEAEITRFNDYFIKSKAEAQDVRNSIEDLRTHCGKIRTYASKIIASEPSKGYAKIFEFIGLKSTKREKELGIKLDKLAFGDFAVANSAEQMVICLELSLKDVQNSLGSGGTMDPDRVILAAGLLEEYGLKFEEMEKSADKASKDVRTLIETLI